MHRRSGNNLIPGSSKKVVHTWLIFLYTISNLTWVWFADVRGYSQDFNPFIERSDERRSKWLCPAAQKIGTHGHMWGEAREAIRQRTCQFFLPFHPSDGRGRLAADGCAGELCLVALADHVIVALDDWATWRDWPNISKQSVRHWHWYSNISHPSGVIDQKNKIKKKSLIY